MQGWARHVGSRMDWNCRIHTKLEWKTKATLSWGVLEMFESSEKRMSSAIEIWEKDELSGSWLCDDADDVIDFTSWDGDLYRIREMWGKMGDAAANEAKSKSAKKPNWFIAYTSQCFDLSWTAWISGHWVTKRSANGRTSLPESDNEFTRANVSTNTI